MLTSPPNAIVATPGRAIYISDAAGIGRVPREG
jgi:hypothetical protein